MVGALDPSQTPPPINTPPQLLLICCANLGVKQCKNTRITIAKANRNIPFINPIHESSSFQILLCQVKLPNMVGMTIYDLKELLMHVPEPMVYQIFVGLLRNLKYFINLPRVRMVIHLISTSILTSPPYITNYDLTYLQHFAVIMHEYLSGSELKPCKYGTRCTRMQRNILKERTRLVEAKLASSKWTNHQLCTV